MSISSNSLDPVASNSSIISVKQQSRCTYTQIMLWFYKAFVVYGKGT